MLISQNVNPKTPITYPIRAGLGVQSIPELVYLLEKSERYWKDSTITLWHGGEDGPLDLFQLRLLVDIVGRNRCFADLGVEL